MSVWVSLHTMCACSQFGCECCCVYLRACEKDRQCELCGTHGRKTVRQFWFMLFLAFPVGLST